MTPHELIRQGKVKEALDALKEAIKADSANPRLRMFYFQLLAITGDWKRSLEQLETAASMDAAQLPVKYEIGPLIRGEAARAEVFAGQKIPLVMIGTNFAEVIKDKPYDWIEELIQSLSLLNAKKTKEAIKMQAAALAKAPARAGMIDGQPFEWMADADSRLGPVIEAYIGEKYVWIPISNIKEINFRPPVDLRDLVWLPAMFAWDNGDVVTGHIPTRYPGTETSDDDNALLAKSTNWKKLAQNYYHIGSGLRFFITDQKDYPMTQVRKITFKEAL